jgi:ATP-dependent Clp protease ATP-binding subunit ClpC
VIFNRFVKDARRCVEGAVEEARLLGHDSVGDEDLLLGILHTGQGPAAEALTSLGVTLDGAREESERLLSEALSSIGISFEEVRRGAGDAFEMRLPNDRRIPFSPRAKEALEQALREARRLGDNRITSEHVLLGILRNEDGTAVRMLANLGVSPAAIEDRLDQARGRTTGR